MSGRGKREGVSPWVVVLAGVGVLAIGVGLIAGVGTGVVPAGESSGRWFFLPFAVGLTLLIVGIWAAVRRERVTGPLRPRTTPGEGLTGYVITVWSRGATTEHTVYADSPERARRMVSTGRYGHISAIRRVDP